MQRPDREIYGFTLGWLAYALIFICLASVVLLPLGWALGWYSTAFEVTGKDNVKEQWQKAYDSYNSLQALSEQACALYPFLEDATGLEKTQREAQYIAIQNQYAAVRGKYNARMQDAFRAKLVKPSDLPDEAPTFNDMLNLTCAPLVQQPH